MLSQAGDTADTEKFVVDRLTKEQRHRCMAAIRSKNTKPEMLVRRYLFSRGFRYRLNHPRLPGHPDLVLWKYRAVIFVNGCFWHGHEACKYFRLPRTNTDFWQRKIERNRMRDAAERLKLSELGWHCITVWECQLNGARREETLTSLEYTLNHLYLRDHSLHSVAPYAQFQESLSEAVEPSVHYGGQNTET